MAVRTLALEDTTRTTPANGNEPEHPSRELPTDVYFPAADGDAGSDARAVDLSAGPYPLVLVVHTVLSTRTWMKFLLEGLAQAGFVAAAADFPLTHLSQVGGASTQHIEDQIEDLSFIADRIFELSNQKGDAFNGAIAHPRYAVIGHGAGGTVALLAAFRPDPHDPRVVGGIAISAASCFFSGSFFQSRTLPLLFLTGSNDHLVPPATNSERAYGFARAPRALVTLMGAEHLHFTELLFKDTGATVKIPLGSDSDLALGLRAYGDGSGCDPVPPPGTDPDMTLQDQHQRTVDWSIAFLNRVLRDRAADLEHLEAANDPNVRVEHDGL